MPDDPMQDIRATYFLECAELMEELIDELDAFCAGQTDAETINTIFRAVHSIKGGAGAFGLNALVGFAHGFENVLDAVRSGTFCPDGAHCQMFLKAADVLGDLIQAAQAGAEVEGDVVEETLSALNALVGETELLAPGFTPQPLALALFDDVKAETPTSESSKPLYVQFTPSVALYQSGNDPIPTLSQLHPDEVQTLVCETGAVPLLEELKVEDSYLAWNYKAAFAASRAEIAHSFKFIEGLCELTITNASEALSDQAVKGIAPAASPAPAALCVKPRTAQTSTVRVDLDRIDRLVNLVGELVINQSMLAQNLANTSALQVPEIVSGMDDFMQLTRDIQDSVMTIRAQPVKSLFQRLNRTVREAAAKTGKEVQFVTIGEATEIDKTVLEQLSEPLTHMIRNAFDHGLEAPELRAAAGKSEVGRITLTAAHKSGRVLLEMHDDGAGLDRARIKAKAVERGLIAANDLPSDPEIDALLFQPGFSTASEITDLSGRGVGMDVVKRAINALGGRVTITSVRGLGTTLSISLPLTLAIMDGMIVKAVGQAYVLPLSAISETFRLSDGEIIPLDAVTDVFTHRGEVFPLLDLGALLGASAPSEGGSADIALLIDTDTDQRIVLRVDAIEDQRQVVIKGLPRATEASPYISAATILGDGHVSFIIDPSALAQAHKTPAALKVGSAA